MGAIAIVLVALGVHVYARFHADLAVAREQSATGSMLASTACGPIEYAAAGEGVPLLVVHGSGGGHDQGLEFARPLLERGFRVIAPSRFGYLRTPMPADEGPQAQADAHACLLDALRIERAAVLGFSAGAASALELAIRHPARVSSLALVVPIAWHPGLAVESGGARSAVADRWLMRLLGSDAAFWLALRLAPSSVVEFVLATPPELVRAAPAAERARVAALAGAIAPVSMRAAGLRSDTMLGRRLQPAALEAVRAPTLVISARDDGFGTYDGAAWTARGIVGARFVGFDDGGHLLVGRHGAAMAMIAGHAASGRDQATAGGRRGE